MILLIDNYDSFVYNLARYFEELGEATRVVRNDRIGAAEALAAGATHLVLSPGPRTPREAGICLELVRLARDVPTLGVCLGHQCLGAAFGARVVRGPPVHGKCSRIRHDGTDLFTGLPSPLSVVRYHSLVVDPGSLGPDLVPLAWTEGGILMALRHRRRPAWGVQFHPEAVLTEAGHALLANFLALGRGRAPGGRAAALPAPEVAPGSVEAPAAE
ncbi:MAG: aminodeoxychorismate/anthranilate synthase component II [Gemmatimonadota bacterium]|nr:aminodeoxychorismate/anthranilate synthase component II [Gemmatimonadota bacterium]